MNQHKTILLKLIFVQLTFFISSVSFSQTYPVYTNTPNSLSDKDSLTKTNNSLAISQQSTSNKNDLKKSPPYVIVTYPVNSNGGTQSQSIQNTGITASNKLQSEKPINPGFDTTSSSGGPTNNQESINYGSNGSVKIQGAR